MMTLTLPDPEPQASDKDPSDPYGRTFGEKWADARRDARLWNRLFLAALTGAAGTASVNASPQELVRRAERIADEAVHYYR